MTGYQGFRDDVACTPVYADRGEALCALSRCQPVSGAVWLPRVIYEEQTSRTP
jgi:hypothetical protein